MEDEEVYIEFKNGQGPYLSDTQINQMQKLIKADINSKLQLAFPVGSTYTTPNNTNPNTILGFGKWERFKGKVAIGLDEDDEDFDTIGATGGEKEVALTSDNNGPHSHYGEYTYNNISLGNAALQTGSDVQAIIINNTSAGNIRSAADGSGTPHNNLQPYQVVGYMWIRTA